MTMMARRERRDEVEEVWVPKTKLGKLVNEGKIASLEELFKSGQRVREPEIVKKLLPELRNEVVGVSVVQKQTDAELTKVTEDGKGKMPAYKGKLTDAQIKDLVAFVRTLKKK